MPIVHKVLFPNVEHPFDESQPPEVLLVAGLREEIEQIIAGSRATYGGVSSEADIDENIRRFRSTFEGSDLNLENAADWMTLPEDREAIEELVDSIPGERPSP